MKTKTWKQTLFLVLTIVVLSGCEVLGTGPDEADALEATGPVTVVMREGQRVNLDGMEASLTFVKLADDSRCPANAACIWIGVAHIDVRLEPKVGAAQAGRLAISGAASKDDEKTLEPANFGRYRVTLIELQPYPGTTERPETPVATIRVEPETVKFQ